MAATLAVLKCLIYLSNVPPKPTEKKKKGKIEAQHLAFELTELFASGELTPQDMDGIMYEMHKAYFKYREQKREKDRIMNL